MDDDVVLCIGGRCNHASGRNLGHIVPGFPEDDGIVRFVQEGYGVVALHRLELVAAGLRNHITVGIADGIEVLDVGRERIVVILDVCAYVADSDHLTAGYIQRVSVLVNLYIFAVLPEFKGKTALKGGPVRKIYDDVSTADIGPHLEYRSAHILVVELLLVGDFDLEEFIAQGLFLGGREQVTVIALAHGKRYGSADGLEGKTVSRIVACRKNHLVGSGELAVEEAVLEVIHRRCRIGRIQRTGAVLPLIRIEAVHGLCGRFSVRGDIPCGKGHGDLVLCIFAVNHNLVSGHPGGLGAVREHEGKRTGFGLCLFLGGNGVYGVGSFLVLAGENKKGCRTCKEYSINVFHSSIPFIIHPSS